MQTQPSAASLAVCCSDIVPDAGGAHLALQPHGHPGEIYRCPEHAKSGCGLCGGSGYRSVCDLTVCHEYGCQNGACGRIESDIQTAAIISRPLS